MILVIRGATLVDPRGLNNADIVVEGEAIREVVPHNGWSGTVDMEIDARGLHVLPGVIDPHVHSRDPGMTHKETFADSTRAAAAGGVTTLLEMPNAIPAVADGAVLRQRVALHQPRAHVDFGLWGLAMGSAGGARLRDLRNAGAVAVKVFWGFYFDQREGRLLYQAPTRQSDGVIPPASVGELWELLTEAAEQDVLVGIHCEDRSILDRAAHRFEEGRDYDGLLRSRPAVAETAAVATVIELAAATGARVHLLHLSSGRSVQLLRSARALGIDISGETCPHYLALTADDFERVGPAMKVYPPVRYAEDRDALWEGLRDGTIDSVGSDHAPHSLVERRGPFALQPAGAVGVETMVPVLLDAAAHGLIELERLAWVLSEGTARRFGLYPHKGSLEIGCDADLTLVDMQRPWQIRNDQLHSKTPLSPFAGRSGVGAVVATILRGQVIARDGEPVGDPLGRHIVPSSARAV
jgi:allantoinase